MSPIKYGAREELGAWQGHRTGFRTYQSNFSIERSQSAGHIYRTCYTCYLRIQLSTYLNYTRLKSMLIYLPEFNV